MLQKQATTAATIGCLVVLLVCIFPPRDTLQTKEPKPRGFLLAEHFDRADVTFDPASRSGTFTRVEISLGRLLAEVCAGFAATGLAICLLVLRRYAPQATSNPVQELVEESERSR
ncbi:MAG: hypothetical protein JWM16_4614 [Verrucomicrobiales bacterium]|nr:hypothetical protein [Verrucomicrobiales bacterium]